MGCGNANVTEYDKNSEHKTKSTADWNHFNDYFEHEDSSNNDNNGITSKHNFKVDNSNSNNNKTPQTPLPKTTPFTNYESAFVIPKEHLNIIAQFNSEYKDANGVQLSTLLKYEIKSSKENTSVLSLSSNEKYIQCLKGINPLSKDLNTNNKFRGLCDKLYAVSNDRNNNNQYSFKKEFHVNINQKIFANYDFVIKLKSIKRNEYDTFEFNKVPYPVLIIFFDTLCYDAIKKIKEIKHYLNNLSDQQLKFLFLPIVNIVTKENDDLSSQQSFLQMTEIDDCYILTHPINDTYIRVFQLDEIVSSKVIIINVSSEISFISNDKAEFLTIDIINYYLFTRISTDTKNLFTIQSKSELTSLLQDNAVYRRNIPKLKRDYLIQVLFQETLNRKYPVHINIKYDIKDKETMNVIINKLKEHVNETKITKYFFAVYEIQTLTLETVRAFEYIHSVFKDNNINGIIPSRNYLLNSKVSNYGKGVKCKKYMLEFYVDSNITAEFKAIYEVLSVNLYNNPKFAQLGVGYSIIPLKDTHIAKVISQCKVMKLYTDKQKQIEFEKNNKIKEYNINCDYVLVINPNYFIRNESKKNKVKRVLDAFGDKNVKFVLCVFSYSEIDVQKLRFLEYEHLLISSSASSASNELNCDIIYINSADINNYSYLKFYNEDIGFYIMHIDHAKGIVHNYIDVDKLQSIDSLIKYINRNKATRFTYGTAIQSSNEVCHNIKHAFLNKTVNGYYNTHFNNILFSNVKFNLYYEKDLTFKQQANNFNEYDLCCSCVYLNISYQDVLERELNITQIKQQAKEFHDKYPSFFHYEINKLDTEELRNLGNELICNKCKMKFKQSVTDSFYYCIECSNRTSTPFILCEKCCFKSSDSVHQNDDSFFKSFIIEDGEPIALVGDYNNNAGMNSCKGNVHEHQLVYVTNYKKGNKVRYYNDIYKKYVNIKGGAKVANSNVNQCGLCKEYIFQGMGGNYAVVLSHLMKEQKEMGSQGMGNVVSEFIICEDCFIQKRYNEYIEEFSKESLIIWKY